ncbi:ribonuclease H-like domain-containing protein, partial [Tanacetum coccineum]
GPTSSLGIIAGERIPHEASPARIPQRHVAGDNFPQRHVAGESPDMSPGKRAIVVPITPAQYYSPGYMFPSAPYSGLAVPSAQQAPHQTQQAQPTVAETKPAPPPGHVGPSTLSGQATILLHAFTTETLSDPYSGAWNMDSDGTLSRYKARLVANGSTQLEGVDVDETFSLVVKPVLEIAHMVNYNPTRTPVDTESKFGINSDLVSDSNLYRSLSGSLQHLTFTRPDISYAVQQGTLDYGLQLFSSSTTDFVAYSDADWAEAEYRSVANAVAETCWLRNLPRELHTLISFATLVYCDNVSAVYLSCNPIQHQRTKHIEIDIHFVRDLVVVGQVRVLRMPSRLQFADIFTKGLSSALFEEF